MADAIDTIGVAPVILGRLILHTGSGMNGDPNPSALPVGTKPKRSAEGRKLIDAMGGDAKTVPANGWQTRSVSAAPLAPAHGHRSRSGEGGKIPAVTDHGQHSAMASVMARQGRK